MLKGLDHVSITTRDLDRSLHFYRDLLGLELRDRGTETGGSIEAITGVHDVEVSWADLVLPDGRVLELLSTDATRLPERRRSLLGLATSHLAFAVEGIHDLHARLTAAGITVTSAPVLVEEEGDWQGVQAFYARDPDGITLEFMQRGAPPADGAAPPR